MYYEEKILNGKYYYRTDPEGKWVAMNASQLNVKIRDMEKKTDLVPELLEACKEVIKAINIVNPLSPGHKEIGYLKDAIAKSEGK